MDHPAPPRPTLWHITISPYSEKVRWALNHKSIPYRLRAPMPGAHAMCALWLTRGRRYTFPVMQMDGKIVGDSTAIIAALEQRHPEAPLYPGPESDRRRALELEDWFDEEVGPYVRRVVFHELIRDSDRFADVAGLAAPTPLRIVGRPGRVGVRAIMGIRYQALDRDGAAEAQTRVLAAFDRLEAELGDSGYLVGGSFTVADLTAAALLYPLVRPPEADVQLPEMPKNIEQLRDELKDRDGFRWAQEMFRRHRRA